MDRNPIGAARRSRAGRGARPARCAALALALALGGCESIPLVGGGTTTAERERGLRMRALLDDYAREFEQVVGRTADQIVAQAPDLATRRAAVLWKLESIPRIRELQRMPDGIDAFLGMWFFTEMMAFSLESGTARDGFGDSQPLVIGACHSLADVIDGVAHEVVVHDKEYEAARADLDAVVAKYAALQLESGIRSWGAVEEAVRELRGRESTRSWLPSLSFSFINPFSGLNESAVAIRYFADKTNALVQDLTTELPWRLELLLYDVEQRSSTQSLVASAARVSEGAVSVAKSAERLPQDVQEILDRTWREVEAQQTEIRETLERTERTVGTVHASLVEAERVVDGLSRTAAGLTEAGRAWEATFLALGLGPDEERPEPAQPEQPSRPFDILDYRDTAVQLQQTAIELRGLVDDVKGLAGEPGESAALDRLNAELQATLAQATEQGRELIDHVALRVLQLLGLILAALVAYRVVARRAARGATPGREDR